MEMCQKLFYLIDTLITTNSAKPVSSDRCQTKRQAGKQALKGVAKPEKYVLLLY